MKQKEQLYSSKRCKIHYQSIWFAMVYTFFVLLALFLFVYYYNIRSRYFFTNLLILHQGIAVISAFCILTASVETYRVYRNNQFYHPVLTLFADGIVEIAIGKSGKKISVQLKQIKSMIALRRRFALGLCGYVENVYDQFILSYVNEKGKQKWIVLPFVQQAKLMKKMLIIYQKKLERDHVLIDEDDKVCLG